ncbi:hypothetical protein K491DRAFT_729926 [Lophiostoma macrostomum CBS 122681]|uniref:Uncharacterized protein n=1 Tax=Lophiostoma macrostomum CBS 122681 TaxID=1314788 RepID=A0A6A6SXF9_9PLEO|nr:hypothetical protein K491DRAFT_729926 [Lophiostoma macrostomum CBS 122681]
MGNVAVIIREGAVADQNTHTRMETPRPIKQSAPSLAAGQQPVERSKISPMLPTDNTNDLPPAPDQMESAGQRQDHNMIGADLTDGAVPVTENLAPVLNQNSGAKKRKSWLEQETPKIVMKKRKVEHNGRGPQLRDPVGHDQTLPAQKTNSTTQSKRSKNRGSHLKSSQAEAQDVHMQDAYMADIKDSSSHQNTVEAHLRRLSLPFIPEGPTSDEPVPLQGKFLTQQVGVNIEDVANYYAPNPKATPEDYKTKELESERDRIAIRIGQVNDILEDERGNYNRGFHPEMEGLLEALRRANDRLEDARMAQRTHLLKLNLGLE